MLNPNTLLAAFVSLYQAIPALVAELPGGIAGYYDQFPGEVNLREAILAQPAGSLLIAYDGDQLVRAEGPRRYRFIAYIRAKEEAVSSSPAGYALVRYLMEAGVPTIPSGNTLPIRRLTIHASCEDMDPSSAARESIVISEQGDTLDLFRVNLSLTEIGDD
jgi:hypothetical protein